MASPIPSSSRNVPSQSTLNLDMDVDYIINPGPIDESMDPKVYEPLTVKHTTMEEPDERIRQYVTNAGFYPWSILSNVKSDPTLVIALVERRKLVTGHSHLTCSPIYMRLLGDYPNCHKDSPSLAKRTWFNNNMSRIPNDAHEETLKRYARAYLLQLMGLTLFLKLSGSSVPLHFLPLLEDLDTVRQYRKRQVPKKFIGVPKDSLFFYRDEFQKMQIGDVIWRSYDERLFPLLNPICLESRQSWRANVSLICFNVIEWHHPGRVMRQYGDHQIIPPPMISCSNENHGKDSESGLGCASLSYFQMWYHRFQNLVDGEASDCCDIAPPSIMVSTLVYCARKAADGFRQATEDHSRQYFHDIYHRTYDTLENFGEAGVLNVDADTIAFDAGQAGVAEEEDYGNPNIDSFMDDRYRPCSSP
ncbi:hypothetical protein QQ045_004930 [Rhodiola kirilowii]